MEDDLALESLLGKWKYLRANAETSNRRDSSRGWERRLLFLLVDIY